MAAQAKVRSFDENAAFLDVQTDWKWSNLDF